MRSDRSLEQVWDNFFSQRSTDLFHRFQGWYRGVVVETNDPLNEHRVRVKIPELYNNSTKTQLVAWAVPAPWMGGRMAGSWAHPAINDIVYVSFEKGHAYSPIWIAAADPTRRRSYSLWSIYTQPASPVNENGEVQEKPDDHLKEYLPSDNRPMSTGWNDRYGNFFMMNSTGFFPKTHESKPAPTGTDALSNSNFETSTTPPKVNDPDRKFLAFGSKYGHYCLFADQGYNWKEEFSGDFDSDIGFEVSRVKYFIKHFNEEKPKEKDQRRIEIRTRAGHKFEMRDVGFEKSRSGEYEGQKTIADSKGKDERWLKLRTKGGHLIQAIDIGFDPENDNKYKVLNKTEVGSDVDGEDTLGNTQGSDSRMIRIITRHGNQLILDDNGSSPTSSESSPTPNGNGVLLRSRKGFQMQMNDKPELDHLMVTTPRDQVLELNDRFQHIILSTSQSGPVHTEITGDPLKTKPRWITQTGLSNDPEMNTHHLKLDKLNDYVRLKNKNGAGIEMRGDDAPCGSWLETRDQENRAVWMSKTDNLMLIRDKGGVKYILLDDNDDVILIRNENGKIQIRAKDKIEIKCDSGNICFEAPNGEIGFNTKKIAISTNGATHVIDGGGIGTTRTIQGTTLLGTHPELAPGPGGGGAAPRGSSPCTISDKQVPRKKPEDDDKERGCDPIKPQKGPVPSGVTSGAPGSGNGSGLGQPGTSGGNPPLPEDDPRVLPPSPTGDEPDMTVDDPVPSEPEDDAITENNPGGGGVLWYGTTNKFIDEILNSGLLLNSLSNNLNLPNDIDSETIELSKTLEYAKGKNQATLAQQRYGDVQLIIRIRNVPDHDLLVKNDDNDEVLNYSGSIEFSGNLEIFEVGEDKLISTPLFQI